LSGETGLRITEFREGLLLTCIWRSRLESHFL
jgi:hypothetical protein